MKIKFIVVIATCIGLVAAFYAALSVNENNSQDTVSNKDFNILLITIDTLRADHLSCYGYHKRTSPNIDNIAKKGIRFTQALATSSWTPPSMASIMTALYPVSHGIHNGIRKHNKIYNQEILSEGLNTLAEVLKENGYTTFGAVANYHMSEELGFGQGFDYYYCKDFINASELNKVIFSWGSRIKKSKKAFIWLHYFDPHDPYSARPPWIDRNNGSFRLGDQDLSKTSMIELLKLVPTFSDNKKALEYLVELYDSEISYTDYHIGNLINKLELYDNSLIIISSDHGEEFLDHGALGHSQSLYQELIHVPLIIKPSLGNHQTTGKTIDTPVSIVDIMPTILGLLEIDPPADIMGGNLLKADKGLKRQNSDFIYSDRQVYKSVLNKNWKYIYHYCTKEEQLYDLSKDPEELDNIASLKTPKAKELKKILLNWVSTSPKAPSIKKQVFLNNKVEKKLKAMGYIADNDQQNIVQPTRSCRLEVCHLNEM